MKCIAFRAVVGCLVFSLPGAATVIASAGGLLLAFGLTVIPPGASACNFTLVPSSQVIPAAAGGSECRRSYQPGLHLECLAVPSFPLGHVRAQWQRSWGSRSTFGNR
jgi:hypothetical protein